MATLELTEAMVELATYHGGLVVVDADGSYDAEATAAVTAELLGDGQAGMVLAA